MAEREGLVFRRSAAAFIITGALLGLFLFMFVVSIWLEYTPAILVSFAASLWQVIFSVWIFMYPYARLDEGIVTVYARWRQRARVRPEEVAGLSRAGNDVEIVLGDGAPLSLSLFWMNPADREPFIQTLSCRCEERSDEAAF